MASIARDPGGRKRILFVDADSNRRAIFLGKMTEKMALAVKIKVEALATAKFTRGTVEDEVSRWVADLPDAMHRKLTRVGLVPWERTLQNLRASRATELSETYPIRMVTAWLGHSLTTAARHYLTVPQEHFERARKTAQSVAERSAQSREAQRATPMKSHENADMLVCAGTDGNGRDTLLAPRGFEPLLPG